MVPEFLKGKTVFRFINSDNLPEEVFVEDEYPTLVTMQIDGVEEEVSIYLQDVPKMIEALQAAYNYQQNKGE